MSRLRFLVLVFLVSCTSSKVMIDYDENVNFSNFKTYQFYEDVGEGLNDLDIKRVTNAITFELKKREIQESENPDFYINVVTKTTEVQNNNTIGIGIGNVGRNGGIGISGGIPIGGKKLNEEFSIEFVNAKSNSLFWQGTINSKINEKRKPEEKEKHYKTIVSKILEKYLIKQKSSN